MSERIKVTKISDLRAKRDAEAQSLDIAPDGLGRVRSRIGRIRSMARRINAILGEIKVAKDEPWSEESEVPVSLRVVR